MIAYCNALVDANKIFYREAGSKNAPAILLLHGFPTSSHMFRNLIPVLAEKYHVIAPDLPGFGFSDAPDRKRFPYTFENLAKVIDKFTQTIGLQRYAMYVFDYGAPVGFRLALAHPERITAMISQNGNAYEEGLSEGWNPIQKYWKESTSANREALREFLTPEATKSQYRLRRVRRDAGCTRSLCTRLCATGSKGQRRHSARSVPRLREQCCALPEVPGILPKSATGVSGGLGEE